jgi:glycine dehydrogenase subunit 1
MSYVPHTAVDREQMLEAIGVRSVEELFADIPAEVRFPDLDLPAGLSELEVVRLMQGLAAQNANLDQYACFLGAGAYRHFIPAVVEHILGRGEFYTAYTPYQPEVSQGTLTAIYEYQSLVCQITGMEVANASMYDGSTALAEAALMAARLTRRDRLVVSRAVHPEYQAVVKTYTQGIGLTLTPGPAPTGRGESLLPLPLGEGWGEGKSGQTDLDDVKRLVDADTAAVLVQYPNFFGCLEELGDLADIAHQAGALLVVSVDPIGLGLLKPPGEFGADIVTGEGQALGTSLSFGGPYLGLFATRMQYVRQMPGRVIGQATDSQGRRGFVLTLQAREQHIRREKATSNICTNEALVALAATVYLAAMGKGGLKRAAELCYHRAHYAADQISRLKGFALAFDAPFFKEFAVRLPQAPAAVNAHLFDRGIIGGYDLGRDYPELANTMLVCVTEMNPKDEIDCLVQALEELG